MMHREGDIFYLKHKSKNIIGNIIFITFFILFCIFTFFSNIEIDLNNKWWDIYFNNKYFKIFIQIALVLFITISIIDIVFYNNYYIVINNKKKCINITSGRWKFSEKINLNFDQIKYLVLTNNMEMVTDYDKVYSYKIDIYDHELNAYEIYDDKNINKIGKIALEISETMRIEISDWTHIENYEGLKKRIV